MRAEQFALHAAVEDSHWWFTARRRIVCGLVRELCPPDKSKRVLDLGCGTGANIATLAREYACTGVDAAPDAVAWSRRRFPDISFREGVAPDDVRDELARADVVLLLDVMEHVADDFRLLSGVLAEMRPGAHLLLTVPAGEELWSRHDETFGHYRRYDPARLAQTWSDLPVEVRLCSYYNTRLYPLVRLIRAWNRLRGRASQMDGTDLGRSSRTLGGLLHKVFAGESPRLVRCLQTGAAVSRRGVSLVAALRRLPGEIVVRSRPAGIAADRHVPAPAATYRTPAGVSPGVPA